MTSTAAQNLPDRYARLAGAAYLAIIVTSILNLAFVESRLVVREDVGATAANIEAHLSLFSFGLAVDLIMFAGVVILAWALYLILRTVDANLALLALLWRMAEAILGGVTVLAGRVVVIILSGEMDAADVPRLVALALDARAAAFELVIIFLCLGTIAFCWLLLRSRYVPAALSALGIAAFALMLVGALGSILAPRYAELAMLTYAPGIVFEVAIGLWLLTKGLRRTS